MKRAYIIKILLLFSISCGLSTSSQVSPSQPGAQTASTSEVTQQSDANNKAKMSEDVDILSSQTDATSSWKKRKSIEVPEELKVYNSTFYGALASGDGNACSDCHDWVESEFSRAAYGSALESEKTDDFFKAMGKRLYSIYRDVCNGWMPKGSPYLKSIKRKKKKKKWDEKVEDRVCGETEFGIIESKGFEEMADFMRLLSPSINGK